MSRNVEQHHGFHPGVEAFKKYIESCRQKEQPEPYDAAKYGEIIDSFGPALAEHLSDEIDTLLGLEKSSDTKALKEVFVAFDERMREGDKVCFYPPLLLSGWLRVKSSRDIGTNSSCYRVFYFLSFWAPRMRSSMTRNRYGHRFRLLCDILFDTFLWGSIRACGGFLPQIFGVGEESWRSDQKSEIVKDANASGMKKCLEQQMVSVLY